MQNSPKQSVYMTKESEPKSYVDLVNFIDSKTEIEPKNYINPDLDEVKSFGQRH